MQLGRRVGPLSTAAPAYLDYIVALFGGWSIVAPFVFSYDTTVEVARNTDVVIGIAVTLIARQPLLRLAGYAAERSLRDLTPLSSPVRS